MRFRKHTLYKKRKTRITRNKRIKTRRKMRHYKRGGAGGRFAIIKSQIEASITEIEPLIEKYKQYLADNELLINLNREYDTNNDSINSIKRNSIYNKAYALLRQKPNSDRLLELETSQKEIEEEKYKLKQTLSEQSEQLPDIKNLLENLGDLINEADKAKQEQKITKDDPDFNYVYNSSKLYKTYRSIVYTVNIFREQILYKKSVDNAKAEKAKAEKASEAVPINKLTSGLENTDVDYSDH